MVWARELPREDGIVTHDKSGVLHRVAAVGMGKQLMDLEDGISKTW